MADTPPRSPRAGVAVRVSDLAYDYPGGTAGLSGLSVEAREGEVLGLLGPNGSGKSTLLCLLVEGRAEGLEIRGEAGCARGRWLASDDPPFRAWLSGRENAETILSLWGLDTRAAAQRAEVWLDRFRLTEVAARPVATYSTGMKKRLSLATAFALDPPLLLLDEPLAALDPAGREILAETVDARKAAGATVVVSTHDPEFAAAQCDRVAFLLAGTCAALDTPGRLLADVGQSPRIIVRFAPSGAPDAGALGSPPAGVKPHDSIDNEIVLEVESPRHALPASLAWLLESGASIVSVEVREPTLRDAFLQLTGHRLEIEDS